MAGWDAYWAAQQADIRHREMQARLREKIAEQDAARGRSLTDAERLANLRGWLDKPMTIDECEADMAARGIVPPPARLPYEIPPKS